MESSQWLRAQAKFFSALVHSCLSACIGSTLAARRAGTPAATSATPTRITAELVIVAASRRLAPTTRLSRNRAAATAANVDATLLFERLFLAAFAVLARLRAVFADKGHDAEANRDLCRTFGAEPHLHERGRPRGSGLGKKRWPVERSNAWIPDNRRSALRHDRLGLIVQSLLQAACIFLGAGRVAREL